MSFVSFTRLKPRPEHLERVLKTLTESPEQSPTQIAATARISLTAVRCVLQQLEHEGRLKIKKQNVSPRTVVSLA